MDHAVHINGGDNGSRAAKPIVLRLLPGEETIFNLRVVNHGEPANISLLASSPVIKAVRLRKPDHYVVMEEVIPVAEPDEVTTPGTRWASIGPCLDVYRRSPEDGRLCGHCPSFPHVKGRSCQDRMYLLRRDLQAVMLEVGREWKFRRDVNGAVSLKFPHEVLLAPRAHT